MSRTPRRTALAVLSLTAACGVAVAVPHVTAAPAGPAQAANSWSLVQKANSWSSVSAANSWSLVQKANSWSSVSAANSWSLVQGHSSRTVGGGA